MRLLGKQPRSLEWKPRNPYTLGHNTGKNERKGLSSILHFLIRLFRWDASHANIIFSAFTHLCHVCAQHAFVLAWEFGSAHEFKSRFSGSNFLSAQSRSTHGGLGASSWPPCSRYKFYAGEGPGWVGWFCSIFAKIELYIHHALVCRPCIDGRYRAYLSIGVLEVRPWPGNLSCRPFSFSKERDCFWTGLLQTRLPNPKASILLRIRIASSCRTASPLPQPSRFFFHSLSRRLYKLKGTRQTDWKCSGHFILTLCTK